MSLQVLILSSIYDFSTDLVAQELEHRGINYFRVNREHLSTYRLTIDIDNSSVDIVADGTTYSITTELNSVYFRQPIFLRNTPSEGMSVNEQLARSQWMGFLRSLTIFSSAKWLNWPESTYLAETKAYQLSLAKKIGFRVPLTLIGNDAHRFQKLSGPIVVKSLDTVLLRESEDCLFTYSTVLDPSALSEENTSSCPLTAQEYISPKIDLRVTIIGNHLSAVKITSLGSGIEGDWRTRKRDELEYTNINLPKNIEDYCFELLKRLKISFGAIDLILSDEEYVFIEINPTGEWGWLVNETRRFDMQIVDWLVSND